MRYLSVLSSVALAIAPTLANIQVSYFNDYDTCNNGDAADRYETIQRDIDSGNCIQGLSGYDTLSIRTTVEEEPLKQCGPFVRLKDRSPASSETFANLYPSVLVVL